MSKWWQLWREELMGQPHHSNLNTCPPTSQAEEHNELLVGKYSLVGSLSRCTLFVRTLVNLHPEVGEPLVEILLNPERSDHTIKIGSALTQKRKEELVNFLRLNSEVFT